MCCDYTPPCYGAHGLHRYLWAFITDFSERNNKSWFFFYLLFSFFPWFRQSMSVMCLVLFFFFLDGFVLFFGANKIVQYSLKLWCNSTSSNFCFCCMIVHKAIPSFSTYFVWFGLFEVQSRYRTAPITCFPSNSVQDLWETTEGLILG